MEVETNRFNYPPGIVNENASRFNKEKSSIYTFRQSKIKKYKITNDIFEETDKSILLNRITSNPIEAASASVSKRPKTIKSSKDLLNKLINNRLRKKKHEKQQAEVASEPVKVENIETYKNANENQPVENGPKIAHKKKVQFLVLFFSDLQLTLIFLRILCCSI
jgi:hypothetical protein